MGIFSKLSKNNQFPILFIGSGISKRYLNEFPSWIELLRSIWEKTNSAQNFYGRYQIIQNALKKKDKTLEGQQLEFETNVAIAKEIEEQFNQLVFEEEIILKDYSVQDFFERQINPFKAQIVSMLKDYTFKESQKVELRTFQKALMKSQVIFTTNYDCFIEDLYNQASAYSIQKYVGQTGFFKKSEGYSEIYKIHGCVNHPNSLVILPEDFEEYNHNSLLISATITTLMINSPIIFLGYSLSDVNVRKYISDFASVANKEGIDLSEKLIIVEYKEDEKELIEEIVYDQELQCRFTTVKTDNYTKIYNEIRSINQGVAPSEIRKYKHLIREIIVHSGQAGKLENVLVTPGDLEKIEQQLLQIGSLDSNLVVAIGDSQVIFRPLSLLEYLKQYYFEADMNVETGLNFLVTQNNKSRQPFMRFLNEENVDSSLIVSQSKENLRQRLANQANLETQLKMINPTFQKQYGTLAEIKELKGRKYTKYALIAHNIDNFSLDKIEGFIKEELKDLFEKGEHKVDSEFRRLMLIHDLKKHEK